MRTACGIGLRLQRGKLSLCGTQIGGKRSDLFAVTGKSRTQLADGRILKMTDGLPQQPDMRLRRGHAPPKAGSELRSKRDCQTEFARHRSPQQFLQYVCRSGSTLLFLRYFQVRLKLSRLHHADVATAPS